MKTELEKWITKNTFSHFSDPSIVTEKRGNVDYDGLLDIFLKEEDNQFKTYKDLFHFLANEIDYTNQHGNYKTRKNIDYETIFFCLDKILSHSKSNTLNQYDFLEIKKFIKSNKENYLEEFYQKHFKKFNTQFFKRLDLIDFLKNFASNYYSNQFSKPKETYSSLIEKIDNICYEKPEEITARYKDNNFLFCLLNFKYSNEKKPEEIKNLFNQMWDILYVDNQDEVMDLFFEAIIPTKTVQNTLLIQKNPQKTLKNFFSIKPTTVDLRNSSIGKPYINKHTLLFDEKLELFLNNKKFLSAVLEKRLENMRLQKMTGNILNKKEVVEEFKEKEIQKEKEEHQIRRKTNKI